MRAHLLITRVAAGAAALSAALLLSPAVAAADGDIGFTVRPATADPADPATRAYFKPVIAAGSSFTDQVVVGNPTDEAVTLIVSPVDGVTGQTSGSVYANRQDKVTETGGWVRLDTDRLTVPAGKELSVGFTVTVPADAPPGDHLAGLAFENARPQTSSGNFQVKQVMRAVVGVHVRVPGPAQLHLKLDDIAIERLEGPGVASVVIDIGNDGRLLGKPEVTVSLRGPNGYERTLSRTLDTILPGDSIPYRWAWPDNLAAGRYEVSVTATGEGASATRHAVIDLSSALTGTDAAPAPAPSPAAPVNGSGGGGIPPWVVAVAVVVGVLGGAVLRRRPRRHPHVSEEGRDVDTDPDAASPDLDSERVLAATR